MSYTMKLTEDERESLGWMAARWEAPKLLDDALHETDEPGVFEIPEHLAWGVAESVREEEEQAHQDAFPCLNWRSPLGEKIRAFLDSIV